MAGPPGVPDRGSQEVASERARCDEAGARGPSALCTANCRSPNLITLSAFRWRRSGRMTEPERSAGIKIWPCFSPYGKAFAHLLRADGEKQVWGIMLLGLGAALLAGPPAEAVEYPYGSLTAVVTHVWDGDTIEVGGTPIRLRGLAAPEAHEPDGERAALAMEKLVLSREVRCELMASIRTTVAPACATWTARTSV
jgi:hypothetical protein